MFASAYVASVGLEVEAFDAENPKRASDAENPKSGE
jgi:hypothetical protein